ncbi:MAG: hypothetical protein WCJ81_08050 [bacterium]
MVTLITGMVAHMDTVVLTTGMVHIMGMELLMDTIQDAAHTVMGHSIIHRMYMGKMYTMYSHTINISSM